MPRLGEIIASLLGDILLGVVEVESLDALASLSGNESVVVFDLVKNFRALFHGVDHGAARNAVCEAVGILPFTLGRERSDVGLGFDVRLTFGRRGGGGINIHPFNHIVSLQQLDRSWRNVSKDAMPFVPRMRRSGGSEGVCAR